MKKKKKTCEKQVGVTIPSFNFWFKTYSVNKESQVGEKRDSSLFNLLENKVEISRLVFSGNVTKRRQFLPHFTASYQKHFFFTFWL